jgi:hypothetical protein
MNVLTADPALHASLTALKERTEIRDGEGRLIGIFTPAIEQRSAGYAEARKLFDPEEIRRRKERSQNDPGRTLDQIVERLRSLR